MQISRNRTSAPYRSSSLIEFLLGDGRQPGWLDEQSHRRPAVGLAQRSSRNYGQDSGSSPHRKFTRREKQTAFSSCAALLVLLSMAPFALYSQTTQQPSPAQPAPSQPAQPSPSQPAQPGGGGPGAVPAEPGLSFAGAQSTVGTGLILPSGVAVDKSGNVFITDANSNLVIEVPANGGPQTTLGSGWNDPTGIAVDGAGNVFICDTNNSRVVMIPAGGGAQITVGTGLGQPVGVAVDLAGDVFIADAINNRVVKVSPGGAQTMVGSGLNFPTGVAVDGAGDVFIADYQNSRVVEVPAGGGSQTTVGSGLYQPFGVAVDWTGDVFIADSANNRIVELSASSGAQTTVLSGLNDPTGAAVDGAGDVFVADSNNSRVLELQRSSAKFAPANICASGQATPAPCSQTMILNYNVTSGGVVAAVNVLTQGAPNLDFALTSSTCTGELYAGSTCAVTVTFAPRTPGLRMGAVQLLYDYASIQNVLASTPVYGQSQGPAIAFSPGAQTSLYPYGGISSYAVAVDGAGDVFISDNGNNQVVKVAPGGAVTTVVSGLNFPSGVAVDGAGDIFIADGNNNRVVEVPAGSGAQTTVGSGLNGPQGVAVDGAGDVFIADTFNNRVVEVQAGGAQTTVGSGLNNPWGVAVDGADDVFIADFHNNRVVEVPAGGGAQTTLATGLNAPGGVAVDAAGDVFIADTFNNRVVEVPAGGGAPTTVVSGLNTAFGLALDGAGNIFIANTSSNDVLEVQRSQPPALSFASTAVGSTSSDSPKSETVQNIGNQPLKIVALGFGIGGNFEQVDGTGTPADCSGDLSLTPGASCNLSISFTPQTAGSLQSSAQLIDTALNAAPAFQTITLSGTATASYDNAVAVSLSSTQLVYPGAAEMTVSVAGKNGSVATGSVTVYDGSTPLTTLSLGYGAAYWWITPGLNVDTHMLSAIYSGDTSNPAGQSAPVPVTVTPAPVNMSASCWNPSFTYGGNYTCTVNVSSNAGGVVPGALTYALDGGQPVNVPLSGGNALFTITEPAVGSHTVVIGYPQQGNFLASSPSTQTFAVTAN